MEEKKQKIKSFLNEQIAQTDLRVETYVFDEKGNERPQRDTFSKINQYVDSFLKGQTSTRWITLTGLRGAGKTTILSQIFFHVKEKNVYKLFISLDQTSQILGASLDEIIMGLEDLLGKSLESLDKPLLLFLDEVQYDPKWGIVLKNIYDRTNKVFILATGSAALAMNSNTDIARRTLYEKLFPLSFSEYLRIKKNRRERSELSEKIRRALFSSENAKQVFNSLKTLEVQANEYYLGIDRHEFNKYLHYGSLPFMIASDNEAIVYDQISKTIDRVIREDMASTGRFKAEIISKIPGILYAVADMDAFNFSTIASNFSISRPTVLEIFSLLENTEILNRIYPCGSHLNQVARKPSKYLFSSPSFRAMYYRMIGNTISEENAQGKLIEDLVGMYLHRIFYKNPGHSLTYDSAEGGADFILGLGKRRIVMEICSGKKNYRQIIATSKKINPEYSLIISDDVLEYSEEFNALKVPLKLFLLS